MREYALYNDGRYSIIVYNNPNTGDLSMRVELPSGWADFPVLTPQGDVLYDRPEDVPKFIKRIVRNSLLNRCRKYANIKDFKGL